MKVSSWLLVALFVSAGALAEEIRYISDRQYVPLRAGQGTNFRITHRGLPSGTRLTVHESNEESGYSRVTTDRGTTGWIKNQYLMTDQPAREQLKLLQGNSSELQTRLSELSEQLQALETTNRELSGQLEELEQQRRQVSGELVEVKRISGNALALDTQNRRLTEDNEDLGRDLELTRAEVSRLRDSETNEAFLNGALAVLIGVMLTLAIPRLWPKKPRQSEWT